MRKPQPIPCPQCGGVHTLPDNGKLTTCVVCHAKAQRPHELVARAALFTVAVVLVGIVIGLAIGVFVLAYSGT